MKYKPIIIIHGEPKSIFLEIFFKTYKEKNKSPIILVSSLNLLKKSMKKFKFNKKIKIIDYKKLNLIKLDNKSINLIDIPFKNSKKFITKCFLRYWPIYKFICDI